MDDGTFAQLEQRLADAELSDRQLWAVIGVLIDILENADITNPRHRRLIDRVKRSSPSANLVRLGKNEDKYALAGADIDCASLLHLCHGRCCSFTVPLSRQDLEEAELKWELEQPYTMLRDPDGYCTYLDRASGGCTSYHNRPAVCRNYDCRTDKRVWKDFDAKIPADMPSTVLSFPGEAE